MCGVAGIWTGGGAVRGRLEATVRAMGDTLTHRGPDAGGVWCDAAHGIALAHRRLAILDLSGEGAQPMTSACGRFVLSFNGEIYNFAELRAELEASGGRFRGRSDTEVMIETFARYGVEPALRRLAGMFAFALWDRRERTLFLGRDRFGKKPLYWGYAGDALVFGSELRALRAHPSFRGQVDRGALTLFLRHNYVPDPYCIYREAWKLSPGYLAEFRAPDRPLLRAYWSARTTAAEAVRAPLALRDREAADVLERVLEAAVRDRMVADVPVGAFLSGGIDSSLVVALMRRSSGRRVRTFTIGFHEAAFDEAAHARSVAEHLGTEHTEVYVRPKDAHAVIPELPRVWDEPFADSSQIPSLLLARLARKHVTVCLSGDGGDEVFGGYTRYRRARALARVLALPRPLRRMLRAALARTPSALGRAADRAHKLAWLVAKPDANALYRDLVSHWRAPEAVVRSGFEPPTAFADATLLRDVPDLVSRLMLLDSITYLPGDILVKVDRASMACSLEVRAPLLDHRVFELAWRLPLRQRVGAGKALLRAVLGRHLPAALFERRKQGFAVPLAAWLREPLREWAEELLRADRLSADGFFDPRLVRALWREHLAGRDWSYCIWDVLMFGAWLDAQRAAPARVPADVGA